MKEVQEDETDPLRSLCCKKTWWRSIQGRCSRNATVNRDGLMYCWQHDPVRVKADRKKRDEKFDASFKKEMEVLERRDACIQACEGVPTEKLKRGLLARLLTGTALKQITGEP